MQTSVGPVAKRSSDIKFINPESYSKISNLELTSKKILDGFMNGSHQSSFHGYNIEFAEHKQFDSGDDPSLIDWKLYARTGRLYSKKFLEERNLRVFFMIDNSASMIFGTPSKWNYSVYFITTLSLLLLSKKDSVGLWLFNTEIKDILPPSSKRSHIKSICRILENAVPSGKTLAGESLNQVASNLKKRSLIILMSDLFSNTESLLRSIRILTNRGHEVIVIQILSPEELNFDYTGTKKIIDIETNESILIDTVYWREHYKKALDKYLLKYNEYFSKSNVDYLLISSKVPIEKALFNLLYNRKHGKVHVILS